MRHPLLRLYHRFIGRDPTLGSVLVPPHLMQHHASASVAFPFALSGRSSYISCSSQLHCCPFLRCPPSLFHHPVLDGRFIAKRPLNLRLRGSPRWTFFSVFMPLTSVGLLPTRIHITSVILCGASLFCKWLCQFSFVYVMSPVLRPTGRAQ